jgi:YD repeat-containing protein
MIGGTTNSNWLLTVVNGGATRSLGYGATGSITSDNRGAGAFYAYVYDPDSRLTQVLNQSQPRPTTSMTSSAGA